MKFAASRALAYAACAPKLGCPLCWPALATLCSMLGVPFLYLNRITLAMTLLALAFCLPACLLRRDFRNGPLALVAASLVLSALYRCVGLPELFGYAATLGVLSAAVWNIFAAMQAQKSRRATSACRLQQADARRYLRDTSLCVHIPCSHGDESLRK